MATYLVTHTDLDGAGCATIARAAIPDLLQTLYADYTTVDDLITQTLAKLTDADTLIIADITPSREMAEELDKRKQNGLQVLLFDHHETRNWIERYPWAHNSDKLCGTSLLHDHLFLQDKQSSYASFTKAVEAWDNWQTTSCFRRRGENLNALLKFIGFERFVSEFSKNPDQDSLPLFSAIIGFLNEKKQRFVKAALKDILATPFIPFNSQGDTYVIVQATDYISEIADAVLEHPDFADIKFVAVYNPALETCSLRSKTFDVGKLAKRLNGGGRSTTAGFPFFMKNAVKEKIFKLISSLDN